MVLFSSWSDGMDELTQSGLKGLTFRVYGNRPLGKGGLWTYVYWLRVVSSRLDRLAWSGAEGGQSASFASRPEKPGERRGVLALPLHFGSLSQEWSCCRPEGELRAVAAAAITRAALIPSKGRILNQSEANAHRLHSVPKEVHSSEWAAVLWGSVVPGWDQ